MFVDLSKAFDSIDYSVLLSKLKSFGIKGMEFDWFCDYLSRRKQRVVVDGHSSEWAHVTVCVLVCEGVYVCMYKCPCVYIGVLPVQIVLQRQD